jgi:hypothetical protein
MALWKVEPTWKKSCIERETWHKDGQSITMETGWRWGEFIIETEGDEPPVIEEGIDLFNCDYEVVDWSTDDGCWCDYEYEGMTEEEIAEKQEWFDDGNSLWDLESDGWSQDDTEMIITCEVSIERVEDTE